MTLWHCDTVTLWLWHSDLSPPPSPQSEDQCVPRGSSPRHVFFLPDGLRSWLTSRSPPGRRWTLGQSNGVETATCSCCTGNGWLLNIGELTCVLLTWNSWVDRTSCSAVPRRLHSQLLELLLLGELSWWQTIPWIQTQASWLHPGM